MKCEFVKKCVIAATTSKADNIYNRAPFVTIVNSSVAEANKKKNIWQQLINSNGVKKKTTNTTQFGAKIIRFRLKTDLFRILIQCKTK